jgi:hypothetical protein
MKISITRALSELKTLGNRYEKSLRNLNLVAIKQGEKLRSPNSQYKEEDFIENAKASLQSSEALYKRIIELKTAIDKSNSITIIKIGEKEMTIQEALVLKKYIVLHESQLSTLQRIANTARSDFEQANAENQAAIEKMVASTMGKDGTETQRKAATEQAEDFIEKTRKVSLVDPCEIDKLVKSLDEEITEFKTNIDYALSESNSVTMVEVSD